MNISRLFLNKYADRLVWRRVDAKYHAAYKLMRHGTYDSERVTFFRRAALWLAVNGVTGDVCEFGTAGGESFLNMYFQFRSCPGPLPHFHLFDSFEGLPDPDARTEHGSWKRGEFSFPYEEFLGRMDFVGVPREHFTATKGFYDATLKPEARARITAGALSLIHIDCDLYESTRAALDFVTPLVQKGTLVLLDDYYCSKGNLELGECGAFREWTAREKLTAVPWCDYSVHGKAFILQK